MGGLISRSFDKSMEKQQKYQRESFEHNAERILLLHGEMLERRMSMQLARSRETIKYALTSACLSVCTCMSNMRKFRSAWPAVPTVSTLFNTFYQYDFAHGSLIRRTRLEAEQIRANEKALIQMPHGIPTFEVIEVRRKALNFTGEWERAERKLAEIERWKEERYGGYLYPDYGGWSSQEKKKQMKKSQAAWMSAKSMLKLHRKDARLRIKYLRSLKVKVALLKLRSKQGDVCEEQLLRSEDGIDGPICLSVMLGGPSCRMARQQAYLRGQKMQVFACPCVE